jgi:hypothetical protein
VVSVSPNYEPTLAICDHAEPERATYGSIKYLSELRRRNYTPQIARLFIHEVNDDNKIDDLHDNSKR